MRRITVLETFAMDNKSVSFKVLFWFPVIEQLRKPLPNFISQAVGPLAPSGSDLQKFRSGEWVEALIPVTISRRDPMTNEKVSGESLKAVAASLVRQIYMDRLEEYQTVPEPVESLNIYGTTYTDEQGWVMRSLERSSM